MTKVEAIELLMMENNGVITLEMIYNGIEKYYPEAKKSQKWKSGLRGVLYREFGRRFKQIDRSVYALIDYDERNLIAGGEKSIVTEKEIMTTVRVQQAKFRENLLKMLKYCPVTYVSDSRILVASHIKPWCLSDDDEKLDTYNGFILSPLYDKLFDSGLITFSPDKEMIISSSLSADTVQKLNIAGGYYKDLPVKGREKYLEFHNEKIFIK